MSDSFVEEQLPLVLCDDSNYLFVDIDEFLTFSDLTYTMKRAFDKALALFTERLRVTDPEPVSDAVKAPPCFQESHANGKAVTSSSDIECHREIDRESFANTNTNTKYGDRTIEALLTTAIKNIATLTSTGYSECKKCHEAGSMATVVSVMNGWRDHETIQLEVCRFLANMLYWLPREAGATFMRLEATGAIINCLQSFPGSLDIQMDGICTLTNFVKYNRDEAAANLMCLIFLKAGGLQLVFNAIEEFSMSLLMQRQRCDLLVSLKPHMHSSEVKLLALAVY